MSPAPATIDQATPSASASLGYPFDAVLHQLQDDLVLGLTALSVFHRGLDRRLHSVFVDGLLQRLLDDPQRRFGAAALAVYDRYDTRDPLLRGRLHAIDRPAVNSPLRAIVLVGHRHRSSIPH